MRTGFEPAVGSYPYNGLANRRFRPLSHLTNLGIRMSKSHQILPGQANLARLFNLGISIMLFASVFAFSGCAVSGARSEYKRQKNPFRREMFQSKPVVQAVGKIVQVDQKYGFAVVDSSFQPTLPEGEPLEVRKSGELKGAVTAKLRVSGETMRPFFVADIVEGHPAKGELVTRTVLLEPGLRE